MISDSESDNEVAQDGITHVNEVASLCHYKVLFILKYPIRMIAKLVHLSWSTGIFVQSRIKNMKRCSKQTGKK